MMGGGNDEEICLIAEVSANTEPYVIELRKAFPDVTFIYYDKDPKVAFRDIHWAGKTIPEGMY